MPARNPLVLLATLAATLAATLSAQGGPPAGFTIQAVTPNTIQLACTMAFAPDGRLFIGERNTGVIRVLQGGKLGGIWAKVPVVPVVGSEAGLLGIAVDPGFLLNRFVYVFTTRPGTQSWENVVVRLQEVGGVGVNPTVIGPVMLATGRHVGGPLEFGTDGKLYVCTGEAGFRFLAQTLDNPYGKILRMNTDGSVPNDNPFATQAGAEGRIWSFGHRNPFGLAVHPVLGVPFVTENGAFRSDEINRIQKAGNFGWPIYEGKEPFPDPHTVDPLWTFFPEPSLTGMCFSMGALYPAKYRGAMFVTAFNTNRVDTATLDAAGRKVLSVTAFHTLQGTVLDVADGPDGNVYVLHHDSRQRGCNQVSRYVFSKAPSPSANLMAVSNRAVGGSITLGVVGRNGDTAVFWLAFRKLASPIKTPFGDLWVPPDMILPASKITADGRVYLGLPLPDDARLRGRTLHLQAGTASARGTKLTPPVSLVLR